MPNLTLKILNEDFTIHRYTPDSKIPEVLFSSNLYSITKTEDELSIICSSDINIKSDKQEKGWNALKVLGPLDFSLTGILADISDILAKAKISIFAISTYDTDYILIKKESVSSAISTLQESDYAIIEK